MLTYIIRRILALIPMLLVISFLVYLGLELTPGDAVSYMIPPDVAGNLSAEDLDALREQLGLNKSFLERYGIWLFNVLQGNFGHSLAGGAPIKDIFFDRLPATLELSAVAIFFSTLFGCVLGTIGALKRGSVTDSGLTVAGMLGVSIPEFFFGLVALSYFSLHLEWLPVGGRLLPGHDSVWDRVPHLVNLMHGLRTALTPVIVLIGFRLPTLIGGSVIIEQIFQWPGIGNEFIGAVRGQDYPLVMMIALFSVLAMLLASLIIDILTALIDPRVRLE